MSEPTKSLKPLLATATLAIILMSFVPLMIRWTAANEVTIGIVRLAIGAVGLSLILLISRKPLKLSRQDFYWLIALGFVFAIHWYAYFRSIKLAGASLAAIGVATFGLHLLLLNAVLRREKLNPTDLFAIILSLVGIYIASPSIDLNSASLNGFMIAVLSGFLFACLPLINRQIKHIPTNVRALGQFGFALVAFLLLLPKANFQLNWFDWQILIVLGVVCTLVAHTLWLKASSELPANITAIMYYGYVPLAIVLSYWVLDEAITWQKLLGASLIVGANILVALQHDKDSKSKKNP